MTLRILVADDHPLMLRGIRALLENRYDVVGAETNAEDLIVAAARLRPDLVVLDIAMNGLNGIEAAQAIRKAAPGAALIFLSMHAGAVYLRRALDAGASGYILKSDAAEELLAGIEAVAAGHVYLSPGLGEDVLESVRQLRDAPPPRALTVRQKQILRMLAEGRQNKEIAEIACISVRTVEFHRSRLMTKLGARSVAELIMLSIRDGLVERPE